MRCCVCSSDVDTGGCTHPEPLCSVCRQQRDHADDLHRASGEETERRVHIEMMDIKPLITAADELADAVRRNSTTINGNAVEDALDAYRRARGQR